MKSDYYVYTHIRHDTNEPYYVGKGRQNRWKTSLSGSRDNRNQQIRELYGAHTELVWEGLTEEEAFAHEILLIAQLRAEGVDLANRAPGGQGKGGYTRTAEEIERYKAGAVKRSQDPRWRANHRTSLIALAATSEWRIKQQRGAALSGMKLSRRDNHRAASIRLFSNPIMAARQRDSIIAKYKEPEYRAKREICNQNLSKKPDWKKKQKEGVASYYALCKLLKGKAIIICP